MVEKKKRGFLVKRYYCGKCNARIDRDDAVCQKCGSEFQDFVEKETGIGKKAPVVGPGAGKGRQKAKRPEAVAVRLPETPLEDEFSEDDLTLEPMPETSAELQKTALFAPKFKTVLWVIIAGLLLFGLFAADTMLIVAAVLVIVVIELEAIRRKIKS